MISKQFHTTKQIDIQITNYNSTNKNIQSIANLYISYFFYQQLLQQTLQLYISITIIMVISRLIQLSSTSNSISTTTILIFLFLIILLCQQSISGNITVKFFDNTEQIIYPAQKPYQANYNPCPLSCTSKTIYIFDQYATSQNNSQPIIHTLYINQLNVTDIDEKNVWSFESPKFGLSIPYNNCSANCQMNITNYCTSLNTFGGVVISIQEQSGQTNVVYGIVCNKAFMGSPFEMGLTILVIFSIFQIVITSKFQEAQSFNYRGFYVNCTAIIGFSLFCLIGQVIVFTGAGDSPAIPIIMSIISFILGIAATVVCTCEFLYWTNKELFRNQFFFGSIRVRLMDIIGFLLGIGLLLGWYFTNKDWILSDIIYILMYTALIKLVKFGSIRMAVFSYLLVGTTYLGFIIGTAVMKFGYFNNIVLSWFNSPFFIMCPTVNFLVNQTCSWFFLMCVAYPGMIMAYLRRYDYSKSMCIYSSIFIVTFSGLSFVYIIVNYFVPYIVPYGLVTTPICIGVLLLFTNRRGETRKIWNGKIFDWKHRNRVEGLLSLKRALDNGAQKDHKFQFFEMARYTGQSQITKKRESQEPGSKIRQSKFKEQKIRESQTPKSNIHEIKIRQTKIISKSYQ